MPPFWLAYFFITIAQHDSRIKPSISMDLWEIRMGVMAHLGVIGAKTTTFSSFIFDFARQIKSVPDIFLGFIFHAADPQPLKSNAGIQDCDRHGVIDGSYRRLVFEPGRHFWVLT
jgi:hypothetical protein